MLGMMLAAAALKTDRYDERLLKCLLANLRISGQLGFQPDRIDQGRWRQAGWRQYFHSRNISYSPHFQATMWACYLWAYRQTGFALFLAAGEDRDRDDDGRLSRSLGVDQRHPAGAGQDAAAAGVAGARGGHARAPRLAAAHRGGPAGRPGCRAGRSARRSASRARADFPPPASNEAYGTAETPVDPIQRRRRPATCSTPRNFAFLALHEAAAATATRSTARRKTEAGRVPLPHPDPQRKPPGTGRRLVPGLRLPALGVLGLQRRRGVGRWSIESGWTQSWIMSVLALRQMKTSMWEFTSASGVARHMDPLRPVMLPDDALSWKLGSPHRLHRLHRLQAHFLQSVAVGVFLPPSVEFAVSQDGAFINPKP